MNSETTLAQELSKHFPMHPSRLKTFCSTILGAMNSGSCQHHDLSRPLDSPSTTSAIRRTERFFQKQLLTCVSLSHFLTAMLDFEGQFDLCLDRSNWEFGEKKINYLVLSWRISAELSLPLFFVELDKEGNSNTAERLDLIEKFIEILGIERIKSLKADREFVGEKWFQHLLEKNIPFYIRFRKNINIPLGKETVKLAGDFFDHLKLNEVRKVYKTIYGSNVCFVGKRIKDGELLIVITNKTKLSAIEVLEEYRKRWSIEELFRKLKTSGFNWEKTHIKKADRLCKLLIILSIALLLTYLMGASTKRVYKKTINCFAKTIFRYGLLTFQKIISISIERAMNQLMSMLDRAKELVFLKSDG